MMTHAIRMTFCAVVLSAMSSLLRHTEAIAQTWPNEPANSTLVTDWGFNALVGGGWSNNGGSATIISNNAAPSSPPAIAQFLYPIGFTGGGGPDNIYHSLPDAPLYYFGYWWKPSNP